MQRNGTAKVSWSPSAADQNILTYRLTYQPLTEGNECIQEPVSFYLDAVSFLSAMNVPSEADFLRDPT